MVDILSSILEGIKGIISFLGTVGTFFVYFVKGIGQLFETIVKLPAYVNMLLQATPQPVAFGAYAVVCFAILLFAVELLKP